MRALYLLASVMLLGTYMIGQQPLTPSQLGTAPLTGEAQAAYKNTVTYGLSSSTTFDDDAPNATSSVNNLMQSIQPDVSISLDRPRSDALFYYSPTYTYSSNVSTYNSLSEAAGTTLKYRLSPRFSVEVKDSYSLTNNSYDSFQAATSNPQVLGILERPNSSSLGTNLRSRVNQASADSTYLLGPHSSIGFGGTFVTLQYRSPTGLTGSSFDSRTWSGHAFYSQQLTPRYSFSLEYSAQNFSSEGMYSTLTHSVLGFWTVSLHQKVQFSVFAGPTFSEFNDSPALVNLASFDKQSNLGFSGGGNLSWQGERSGLSASFVQRVSDSGAAGGAAVDSRTATLQFQRKLTTRITANLFANYVSNSQLDPLSTLPDFGAVSGGIGFSRTIAPHLSVDVSAFRQAFTGNSPQVVSQHDHDVATLSISYSFTRPIGR